MVGLRLCIGMAVFVSLAACQLSGGHSATAPTASASGTVASSAASSSSVPAASDDRVAIEWCGAMTVGAALPGGAAATFRPAETDRFSIRVGQTFGLTATSRCRMAFQVDGEHVAYTPGSSWPLPFAGIPGLPSGVVLPSPRMRIPPETVSANLVALTAGISQVAVEVDVPAQEGGYLQPVTATVMVTP